MIELTQDWPGTSEELGRALSQFQRDVANHIKTLGDSMVERYTPTTVKRATYTAKLWDMVRVDSTNAVTHLLTEATKSTRGARLCFVRSIGSATVTLRPLVGTIDGSSTYSWTSGAFLELVSDGDGDWRVT